jgi:hypothetical protein
MRGVEAARLAREAGMVLLFVISAMTVSCAPELSPAEEEFARRSAQIVPGQPSDEVKKQLGDPTRTVDASGLCRDRGGQKQWVYETFDTPAGRTKLRGGATVICVNDKTVVMTSHVHEY